MNQNLIVGRTLETVTKENSEDYSRPKKWALNEEILLPSREPDLAQSLGRLWRTLLGGGEMELVFQGQKTTRYPVLY